MIEETVPMPGTSTAVELARLSGRIDQVISDHERRLTVLETRAGNSGSRVMGYVSAGVAVAALLLNVALQLNWG